MDIVITVVLALLGVSTAALIVLACMWLIVDVMEWRSQRCIKCTIKACRYNEDCVCAASELRIGSLGVCLTEERRADE